MELDNTVKFYIRKKVLLKHWFVLYFNPRSDLRLEYFNKLLAIKKLKIHPLYIASISNAIIFCNVSAFKSNVLIGANIYDQKP